MVASSPAVAVFMVLFDNEKAVKLSESGYYTPSSQQRATD
jgi:hypothetical protein